jgi:hypothetical protein
MAHVPTPLSANPEGEHLEESGTETLEKAAGIVPTLYYDIIARIIPGVAFLLALSWKQQTELSNWIKVGSWSVVLFIFLAYLAGMLLTAVGLVFDFAWYWLSTRLNWLWSPWDIGLKIDELFRRNASVGNSVLKMYAETTMFENLLAAIAICWLYSLGAHLPIMNHWLAMAVSLVLALVGLVSRVLGVNSRAHLACSMCEITPPDSKSIALPTTLMQLKELQAEVKTIYRFVFERISRQRSPATSSSETGEHAA